MERWKRLAARPDWPIVSALALGLLGLVEAYVYTRTGFPDLFTTFLLTLTATLALAFRRTHLKTVAAVTSFSTLVLVSSGPPTPETAAVIIAQTWVLYLLAERARGWVTVVLGVLVVFLTLSSGEVVLSNLLLLAAGIGALGVGNSRRLGGQVSEVRASRAALEERARIARELHDVVAHHVSTIAIQADTARLTTPGMPVEGSARLEAIGETARDAMTEMRRVLGVLRTEEGGSDLAPQPGLDRLGELLETARGSGTPVRLVLEGDPAPLAPTVELTAYRIVQEALTNARRHAPGAPVEVSLRYGPDDLWLSVRDEGPGPNELGSGGQGLRGMHERVALVGGELVTGGAVGGGFRVEARLPT
ncbi:sensor histidine kinase [Solirubrobacter soli]|uniref:sensor histidine kinase n=1 Tax=Solirubrobacter soli TaxID=363832 RepID=UPI0004148832|nr:sensor histidine kinase [Solirubrobacter soli]